jgi:hypothetical protein
LVAELDRRGTWAAQGLRSCAHWLNWRCGTSLGAAREQVRVGRALAERPVLCRAFSNGELSYSKVRAITRVATAELEGSLVELARYATASQLERIVGEYRRADPEEGRAALKRHGGRYLRTFTDDEGMVVVHARLSPEDGAVVLEAIEAARRMLAEDRREGHDVSAETRGAPHLVDDGAPGTPDVSAETRGAYAPGAADRDVSAETRGAPEQPGGAPGEEVEADRADALVAACESALSHAMAPASGGGRVLAAPGAEGCSSVAGVGVISAHTAQRLACDAAVARLRYGVGGTVEPEGRTREIPPALRRAVLARDRGCRWPGCTQRRFVDVHHVRFVSLGGRTVLSNLVSACRFHHRLVHEGGYRLTMDPSARVRVFSQTGAEIPQVPPPTVAQGPDVAAQHAREGLDIDAETLAYRGEPFDLGLTIDCLLSQVGRWGLPVGGGG